MAGSLSGVQIKTAAAEDKKKMPWLRKSFYIQIKSETLAQLLPGVSGEAKKRMTQGEKWKLQADSYMRSVPQYSIR